jgi:glycosyltransferase involved in cell wall biosynthesis
MKQPQAGGPTGTAPTGEGQPPGDEGRFSRARPRLVHVTTTDMSLEWLLGPQLRAFAAAGYEVIGASAPGPFVAGLEAGGIAHVPLRHATRAMAPGSDVAALAELHSLFRRLQPDLVHTHNPKPGLYGRVAARAAGVPAVVNTVHGLYAMATDRWVRRSLVYGLERVASVCSDAELVQNPEDLRTLANLGVPGAKLRLLGNGVDLGRFDPSRFSPESVARLRHELGVGPSDVMCLLVGRLVVEKGYREAFTAAAQLRRRLPQLRVVVAGPTDAAKADAMRDAEIQRAEREAGVRFLGLRHDIDALYAAADLYVLASHREGFPRSAMEAAAMGLPVVATDIRGCRQVVEDGVTGVLVPVRDTEALAGAVAQLVGDGDLRRRMGVAARARACREFDQQRVIAITLDTYRRLLSAGGRRPSPSLSSISGGDGSAQWRSIV